MGARMPALSLHALALAAALTAAPMVSAQQAYTFEALHVNGLIHGQDNWIDKPGQGQAAIRLDGGFNGTKVAWHVPTVVFNESAYLARVNDGGFSFAPIAPSQCEAIVQFECTGDNIAVFALGTDLDGDGILSAGEIGPAFGTDDRTFRVEKAAFGSSFAVPFGSGNGKDDWYRMRLEIDLAANGGDGSGSLSYRNLTDGDPDFVPLAGLQNLELGLLGMDPAAPPTSWNTMWLHLRTGGGNTPSADNLVPNAKILPPQTYCTPKPNSQGCQPGIGHAGVPSASSPSSFDVTAANVINNKNGVLFYGYGPAGLPFQGGFLCVQPPIRRTAVQSSAGNPPPDDCSGAFSYDFNSRIQSGVDPALVPCAAVCCQYWYRDPLDPSGFGTGLSDALRFEIQL